MTKLLTVGRRLAVLGVRPSDMGGSWCVVNPGSYNVPQVGDAGKTMARSMCGRWVITNGYASDFTPSGKDLCPACEERV